MGPENLELSDEETKKAIQKHVTMSSGRFEGRVRTIPALAVLVAGVQSTELTPAN